MRPHPHELIRSAGDLVKTPQHPTLLRSAAYDAVDQDRATGVPTSSVVHTWITDALLH